MADDSRCIAEVIYRFVDTVFAVLTAHALDEEGLFRDDLVQLFLYISAIMLYNISIKNPKRRKLWTEKNL